MTDPASSTNPARRHRRAQVAAWLCLAVALAVGVHLRNPAVVLLGGLLIRLGLGVNPVKRGMKLGTISIQTAVVLLGLTLSFDRVVSVSADYGVIVGAYVLMTLLLGWVFARLFRGNGTEAALLTSGTAICGVRRSQRLRPWSAPSHTSWPLPWVSCSF